MAGLREKRFLQKDRQRQGQQRRADLASGEKRAFIGTTPAEAAEQGLGFAVDAHRTPAETAVAQCAQPVAEAVLPDQLALQALMHLTHAAALGEQVIAHQ